MALTPFRSYLPPWADISPDAFLRAWCKMMVMEDQMLNQMLEEDAKTQTPEEQRKQWFRVMTMCFRAFLPESGHRSKLVETLVEPLRRHLTLRHTGHDNMLVDLVAITSAVLDKCDGTEEYDKVAFQGVYGDARQAVEGLEVPRDTLGFVRWIELGMPSPSPEQVQDRTDWIMRGCPPA